MFNNNKKPHNSFIKLSLEYVLEKERKRKCYKDLLFLKNNRYQHLRVSVKTILNRHK